MLKTGIILFVSFGYVGLALVPFALLNRRRLALALGTMLLGLLVRPAAIALAVTMVVAILSVHIGNGLFMSNNGYEFGLALLAAAVALAISGGGRASVDAVLAAR